jgi:glyoxylase-like metal-dependent hydrolase (beta-lactamase superfamily II)
MTGVTHHHGHSPGEGPLPVKPTKTEQLPASDDIVEVAPGVIRMQLPIWMPGLGHVNMYGLLDDRGLAIVDPGLPGPKSWKALTARLKSAGFRVKDVHTVIVTHSHPDHFGGAGRVAKTSGARLITHHSFSTWTVKGPSATRTISEHEAEELELAAAAVAQRVDVHPDEIPTVADEIPTVADEADIVHDDTDEEEPTSRPWGSPTPWGTVNPGPQLKRRIMIRAMRVLFDPPEPTERVHHGDHITLAGREWWAVHTPGHTVDHLCLYDPDTGTLLSGDHVLPTITPHVSGVRKADSLKSYLATLDLVARLPNVRLGLPAHGEIFHDVPGRAEAIKEHHFERMEVLRSASLSLGPASVQALARELFPKRHWGVMAESETFAHLMHLQHAGEAESWHEDEQLYFRVAPKPSAG